jgi:hypothetical protein
MKATVGESMGEHGMRGGGSGYPSGGLAYADGDRVRFTLNDALDLLEHESDPVALGDLVQQVNQLFEERDQGEVADEVTAIHAWTLSDTSVIPAVAPVDADTGDGVFQGELPIEDLEREASPSPPDEPSGAGGFDGYPDFGPIGSGWDAAERPSTWLVEADLGEMFGTDVTTAPAVIQ